MASRVFVAPIGVRENRTGPCPTQTWLEVSEYMKNSRGRNRAKSVIHRTCATSTALPHGGDVMLLPEAHNRSSRNFEFGVSNSSGGAEQLLRRVLRNVQRPRAAKLALSLFGRLQEDPQLLTDDELGIDLKVEQTQRRWCWTSRWGSGSVCYRQTFEAPSLADHFGAGAR